MLGKPTRGGRRSGTRAFSRHVSRSVRRFDRDRLPSPAHYYHRELSTRLDATGWVSARCPFHEDKTPSLSLNLDSGGFVCHACGEKGGDVLAFHMARYGLDFMRAAEELGAWM